MEAVEGVEAVAGVREMVAGVTAVVLAVRVLSLYLLAAAAAVVRRHLEAIIRVGLALMAL
jgi:hypothetical protein